MEQRLITYNDYGIGDLEKRLKYFKKCEEEKCSSPYITYCTKYQNAGCPMTCGYVKSRDEKSERGDDKKRCSKQSSFG